MSAPLSFVGGVVVGPVASAAGPAPATPAPNLPHVSGTATVVFVALVVVAVIVVRRVSARLRALSPVTWWRVFGLPVALWRLVRSWRPLCEGLGLAVPARRFGRFGLVGHGAGGLVVKGEPLKMLPPRRAGLRLTESGFTVLVRLWPSQVPDDYVRASSAFAHAWHVHDVRVSTRAPGVVALTALGFDPLTVPRPRDGGAVSAPPAGAGGGAPDSPDESVSALGMEPPPAASTDGRKAPAPAAPPAEPPPDPAWAVTTCVTSHVGRDVLRMPVGITEDGSPWIIDFGKHPHFLTVGATRSGKSTLTVALLVSLAPCPVGLVGIDCKGGMELGLFAPRLSGLATTRAEAAAVLEALTEELARRMRVCRVAGARSIWDLPEGKRPVPLVVVVDEVAELLLYADKSGREESQRCVTSLVRVAQLGAALGLHLWVAGQRFGSDLGPGATLLRAQLSGRVCHRVADPETASMTLAGLPPDAVAAALAIPAGLPGVAVVGDDSGTWMRARSGFVPIEEAERVAHDTAWRRPVLPGITDALPGVGGGV